MGVPFDRTSDLHVFLSERNIMKHKVAYDNVGKR